MAMNDSSDDIKLYEAKRVSFRRNDEGDVLLVEDGQERLIANIVSAFPLTHPRRMVSLRDQEGREIGILDRVRDLDGDSRQIVATELDRSYFMPRIKDIMDVQEKLGVTTWDVETNRGPRTFQVRRARHDVRRIGPQRFVVRDVDGNRYEIRDWMALPAPAQKLIEGYV